jgi:cytochrome c-type biogenesis protein CcmH
MVIVILALAVALALFASWTVTPAGAQSPNIDDEVNRIARNLYCPVCPNTPLDVCSTLACVQWRQVIKDKLQQGQTEQQIRDYFVAQYGQQVLGAPPPQGFNWLAYILPVVGLVLGGTVAWFTVRQWLTGRSGAQPQRETASIPPEYADRIEKDLKEY